MGEIVTSKRLRAVETPEAILATSERTVISAPAPETEKAEPAETPDQVTFVKNINPKEQIIFKDGTKFKFPTQLLVCKDKELIRKISEVAETYNIVHQ
jgi:hypothetical protein